MARPKIDWARHIADFEESGLRAPEFCAKAGLKLGSFRSNLYKSRLRSDVPPAGIFREFPLDNELTIFRDNRGEISIRGIDPVHLSAIVGAWSDALSQ